MLNCQTTAAQLCMQGKMLGFEKGQTPDSFGWRYEALVDGQVIQDCESLSTTRNTCRKKKPSGLKHLCLQRTERIINRRAEVQTFASFVNFLDHIINIMRRYTFHNDYAQSIVSK